MAIEVKICGLKTAPALDAALAGGASHVGFVFFPKSPRAVSIEEATLLADRARGRAAIVALTVDADDALLAEIAETVRPDLFQFHGHETPHDIDRARATWGIPVMKALKIGGREDLEQATAYSGVADRLLFDAKPRPGEGLGLPGGNGVSFDWRLLTGLSFPLPVMLSGGLDPDNVQMAIELSGLSAVDVSSGVERAPGDKDPARISDFLTAAHVAAAADDKQGVPA